MRIAFDVIGSLPNKFLLHQKSPYISTI